MPQEPSSLRLQEKAASCLCHHLLSSPGWLLKSSHWKEESVCGGGWGESILESSRGLHGKHQGCLFGSSFTLITPKGDLRASFVAQMIKNLPGLQETRGVQSLGWEDPLEEGLATHSSIHA